MRLAFVTPVHQRFELTAICFDQRALVIEELREHGIDAVQVVVGDDENLAAADARGFCCVEQNNDLLGRKFNDGWEFAARQLGADWITPIGSDSWVKPEVFLHDWDDPRVIWTSPNYTVIDERGERALVCNVSDGRGAGPHVIHRSLLEPCGFRPAADERQSGIDTSTIRGIQSTGAKFSYRDVDVDEYQYVGFRSEQNITSYEKLKMRWGVLEGHFDSLYEEYPHSVVDAANEFYDGQIAKGLA